MGVNESQIHKWRRASSTGKQSEPEVREIDALKKPQPRASASSELLRALSAVARGDSYLDPAITGKVFSSYTDKSNKLRGEVRGAALTGRESETLRLIALGYINKEIAEHFDISVKTVETHKANAQQKLTLKTRKDIISYAILQGWMQGN